MQKTQEPTPENEIIVTNRTDVVRAVERIEEALKTHDHVLISGINSGISGVVIITEIALS